MTLPLTPIAMTEIGIMAEGSIYICVAMSAIFVITASQGSAMSAESLIQAQSSSVTIVTV